MGAVGDYECCLFDFDNEKISTRMPEKKKVHLPKIAVMCFFKEVVEKRSKLYTTKLVMESYHDVINWHFYKTVVNGNDIAFCYAPMGAPLCVNIMEDLFINGVETVVACGGCGVLENIETGKVLVPTVALRDEGTSFHYMKPSLDVKLDNDLLCRARRHLLDMNIEYREVKTWTTDASKRETPRIIKLRKQQGCQTVEMECSALAACARFRDKEFLELLYSGDVNNF